MQNRDTRCYICFAEWNAEQAKYVGIKGCPNCKTEVMPMKIAEDGYIHVNWQDIRVLAIFAQRWIETFPPSKGNDDAKTAVRNIVQRLYRFKPSTGYDLDPMMQLQGVQEAIDDRKIKGMQSPYFKKLT